MTRMTTRLAAPLIAGLMAASGAQAGDIAGDAFDLSVVYSLASSGVDDTAGPFTGTASGNAIGYPGSMFDTSTHDAKGTVGDFDIGARWIDADTVHLTIVHMGFVPVHEVVTVPAEGELPMMQRLQCGSASSSRQAVGPPCPSC